MTDTNRTGPENARPAPPLTAEQADVVLDDLTLMAEDQTVDPFITGVLRGAAETIRALNARPAPRPTAEQAVIDAAKALTRWVDDNGDPPALSLLEDVYEAVAALSPVATGMGRTATGIDLDERNTDLCRERVGMFLEVIERTEEGVA